MITVRMKHRIIDRITDDIIESVEKENVGRDLSDDDYDTLKDEVTEIVERAVDAVDKRL